mmetsp:Transcript_73880/g.196760  ORF Transcript_73880/g.196760 Transcript_73880/m.196760 type:complete len:630 (+) Transcript_73880:521-2410(+)
MLLKLPVSCSQRLVACCLMPKMRSLFYRMFPAVDASIWAAAEASGFALCFAMEDDHIRRLLPSCSTLCTGITQTGAVFVFRRIEANSRELLFPEAHATNGRGFSNLDQSFVLPPPGSDGIITISISQVPDASSAIAAGLPVACRQTRTSCSAGPGRNPPSELRTNESADIGLRVVRTGARVLDSASLFYLSASLSAAWSSQPPGAGTSAAGACKRGSLRALAIEGGLPVTGSITGLEALGGAIVAGRLQLRSLSLSGGGLGVEGARVFCREAIRALKGERAELATSPWALQRLDLSGNRLESTGLSLIAAALGFDASPHCSGDPSNGQATGDSSLGGVSPPPQLHALNLCGNNLGSGVGDALRAFDCVRTRDVLDPGCHSANEKLSRVVVGIEFLDLSSNDLESQFATDLASSLVHYFPTLKASLSQFFFFVIIRTFKCVHSFFQVLVLDGNPLGPSGAETLADSLFKLVDLRELSLVGCWLGDEGAMEVSIGAPNCQRLTRLDLTSNGLTCAAAEVVKCILICQPRATNDILAPIFLKDISRRFSEEENPSPIAHILWLESAMHLFFGFLTQRMTCFARLYSVLWRSAGGVQAFATTSAFPQRNYGPRVLRSVCECSVVLPCTTCSPR